MGGQEGVLEYNISVHKKGADDSPPEDKVWIPALKTAGMTEKVTL